MSEWEWSQTSFVAFEIVLESIFTEKLIEHTAFSCYMGILLGT